MRLMSATWLGLAPAAVFFFERDGTHLTPLVTCSSVVLMFVRWRKWYRPSGF